MAEVLEGAASLPGVLHTCSIGPKSEDAVLKSGLLAISQALGTDGLLEFPRRPNGTPMLTRQGFFERILKGEVSLQDANAADASAAEADVKRLGLKQLLAIRCKNLDFLATGAKKQGGKASFLSLVDRCTTAALTERLLAGEVLPDAHRALAVKHAVLIYGANMELKGLDDEAAKKSEWWLFAVGGSRRYLHLPRCVVSNTPPNVPVYCYRSHSQKDPRDPKRATIFRWQAVLMEDASRWTEDPLETEQKKTDRKPLIEAPKKPDAPAPAEPATTVVEPAVVEPAAGFSLFGDFDVEDLFDEFDTAGGGGGSPGVASSGGTSGTTPAKAAAAPDIDDFFDSLLAETLDETPSPTSQSPAAIAQPVREDASSAPQKTAEAGSSAAVASATATATPAASAPPAAAASTVDASAVQPAAQFVPPPRSAGSGGATSIRDGGGDGSGGGRGAAPDKENDTVAAEVEEEPPPRDAAEARLRASLERFYNERKTKDKLSNVAKITQKYHGERVVDLWAMLASKYSLPPFSAVQWLASTLPPLLAVQWPKGQAPATAVKALESAAQAAAGSSDGNDDAAHERKQRTEVLCTALKDGDVDAIGALSFYGCPDPTLRPQLWRALLGFADEGQGSEESGLQQRRDAYRELKERAAAAAASPDTAESNEGEPGANLSALRGEVEADAKAAWRGDEFVARPEVLQAVVGIVFTHAWKRSYVRGMCEIAALLLHVMAQSTSTTPAQLADAEADSFWCFSTLMAEVQDSMTEGSTAEQAKRVIVLLRCYDAPLAELLAAAGLSAMPTLRLAGALFTRGGFTLADCTCLWDTMLADPRRFELCDYTVVAMLLLHRGELMQLNDVGGLAETMLAAPGKTKVEVLLSYTYAICAFERRCAPGSPVVFPPRPQGSDGLDGGYGVGAAGPTLDNVVQAAQEQFSSLSSWWGKAVEAGRSAAGKAAAQAGEYLTEERVQNWKEIGVSTAQAAASHASAAYNVAAEKTAAAAAVAAARAKEAAAAAQAAAAAAAEKSPAPDGDEEKVMFEAGEAAPATASKDADAVPSTAEAALPADDKSKEEIAAQAASPPGSKEVDDIAAQLAELEGQPTTADDEVPQLVSADEVPQLVKMSP